MPISTWLERQRLRNLHTGAGCKTYRRCVLEAGRQRSRLAENNAARAHVSGSSITFGAETAAVRGLA
eukprot:10632726-Lingulodinium_polyedra.AAC.1